ncbi:MAG TPA: iron-containing redox enzyme family protein [Arthrobacter sp.]|nr:iron-containing redox enzyme family protein [Arthrobacter sp.]
MRFPKPGGPIGTALQNIVKEPPDDASVTDVPASAGSAIEDVQDVLNDDDFQRSLFCLYQLHYSGFDDVDDDWEWHPGLLKIRTSMERRFEDAVRSGTVMPQLPAQDANSVAQALFAMAAIDDGPSLPRFASKHATAGQLRELVILRSLSQLREADPHTWAIPRLSGRAKAALVEIQADEYGGGRPERVHAVLYAQSMRGLGLDDAYGAYFDEIPAATIASVNLMSLFGLHRRLRGAIIGHLAIYEMSSSIPNGLYARGFERLGFGDDVTDYFSEHVEADSVHEQIAGTDMAGALVEAEPDLLEDVMFGAAAAQFVDSLATAHVLDNWKNGTTALRPGVLQVQPG